MAGLARGFAEAVPAAGRRRFDVCSDAGAGRRPVAVRAAGDHHRRRSAHHVTAALAEAGIEATVLLEPVARDTAPAVAAAAAFVAGATPDAMMLVLAADHVIRDLNGFRDTVRAAVPAAEAGRIVVFGIRPTGPATGYGYIRPGAATGHGAARAVAAFVEKPDSSRASHLIADGYLWNSGMFLMRASDALDETRAHAPAVAEAAQAAMIAADDWRRRRPSRRRGVRHAPKVSVDHAVMEKTRHAAVVDAGFDWSDVGTWSAVWEAAARDDAGNVAIGDAVLLDTRGSYVSTSRPRVGVVGVSDAVVVATDDAVLVTTRGHADRSRISPPGSSRRRRRSSAISSATTGPGAITSRSTRASAIRSSASSSIPARACRCRNMPIAPSTGRLSRASPRSPSAWSATR